MDINLVTAAEAARRAGISTRTIGRWIQEGRLNRYWWGRGTRRLGPRVATTEVERLLGIVTSNGRDFLLNRPRRGFVEIRDQTTGNPVDTGGAVAYTDASIEAAVPHPDGWLAALRRMDLDQGGGELEMTLRHLRLHWLFRETAGL